VNDPAARFAGVARLLGAEGLARLRQAHVCVVGVGGVGSWTVEALARSGVGRLTLVDGDKVDLSNTNRQLHAVDGEFGRPKVEVLAERVRRINPECAVMAECCFFTDQTAERLLERGFDYVVDAIDRPLQKCLLIAGCHARGIPVVTAGGAAGRRDPTAVRVADLARSTHDALLQEVRRGLRREHGFPREGKVFGVECVYSTEELTLPATGKEVPGFGPGETDSRPNGGGLLGTAAFVTGAYGLAAAAVVVRRLAGH